MEKNYQHCLEMILHHEGGYVNHPEDPGGATNLGVTKRVYEEWVGRDVTLDKMEQLQVSDVAPIIFCRYFAALPVPAFTPKSKTQRSRPDGS